MPLDSPTFEARLQAVEDRINRAIRQAGRARSDVILVAVSKKFSASAIEEAYGAGLRHFGENYVQEFASKQPQLRGVTEATFHLIGHLQSNKAKLAASLFEVVQTIDSTKLMSRLDVAAAETGQILKVLLEVKLSDEDAKSGAPAADLPALLEASVVCKHLQVTGLMTVPPWSEDPESSRPYFQELADYARQYGLPGLSMGMSNDFEVAIQEGATIIRVGTALFGSRPKSSEVPLQPA